MKIFLSSLENTPWPRETNYDVVDFLEKEKINLNWNLMSYFYLGGNKKNLGEKIRDKSKEVLIDSGAHSFQKGKKVDFFEYTKEYANFIKEFDRKNVVGFFEMDIDNIIGYEKVLELRKILRSVSDKIIPVWHRQRGIEDYIRMCEEYSGKVIAIGGFKNTDVRDDQYIYFLKYAKKYNCKLHCLGMTRTSVLDKVPFDYVDSSSWLQNMIYGRAYNLKTDKKFAKAKKPLERIPQIIYNYKQGVLLQEKYHARWRGLCKD